MRPLTQSVPMGRLLGLPTPRDPTPRPMTLRAWLGLERVGICKEGLRRNWGSKRGKEGVRGVEYGDFYL